MIISKFGFARVVTVLLGSFALTACGTHIGTPRVQTMTEAEADENIAARLEKTSKVRKELNELRDGFKKAEIAIKSLGFILNKTLDQPPGEFLVQLVDRIPAVFGSLSRSLVKTEVDGTWKIEAPILAGLSLSDITLCPSPAARLTGKRVLDQEDVVLYVSDCNGTHWDRLAKWIIRPDGGIEMSYWPLVLANLRPMSNSETPDNPGAPAGSCRMNLSAGKKEVTFSCTQIRFQGTSSVSYLLESFSIRDITQGTSASIAIASSRGARAQIDLEPNHSPVVTLCEEGVEKCSIL